MKKRIIFLTIVLAFALTISVYADHGEYMRLSLNPGETDSNSFYDHNLDSGDNDIHIGVICENSNSNYIVTLYDITTNDIVFSDYFTGTSSKEHLNVIDYTHDYQIKVYNSGSSTLVGQCFAVIK